MNRAHTIKARPSRDHDRGFFSPPLPRIFAHRGLAIGAPENTLLAFLKAMSAGATHIETDVHATLDGVAVISHDPDLARLVGRSARVEQFTMAELRRIDREMANRSCRCARRSTRFLTSCSTLM